MLSRNLYKGLFALLTMMMILGTGCDSGDNIVDLNPILSSEDEKALGDSLYGTVLDNPDLYPILNPAINSEFYTYLQRAFEMVVNQTNMQDRFDWRILVIENDNMETAFTFPGGKVFISTGMLKFLENEHQLIQLLAHEAYYADRNESPGIGELSYVMQKLKDEFANTSGTRVFIDIVENNAPETALDIITTIPDFSFEEFAVLDADEYALEMICDHYLYAPTGLRKIIEDANEQGIVDFKWLEIRPPGQPNGSGEIAQSSDPLSTYGRLQAMNVWDIETCGDENVVIDPTEGAQGQPYSFYKDLLP